jgi:3'(2'), 5'-bisphosphate nucleotidase
MSSVNLLDLAASAVSSVIVAADQIKQMCSPGSSEDQNVRLKADGSFVTDADFAAQSIIVQALRSISAEIRIVGEESEEEMALQTITGHEDRYSDIFQVAQSEILMRHSRSEEQPLPLAQIHKENDDEERTHKNQNNQVNPKELSRLEEYEVDPTRVSVFIDPLDGTTAYAKGEYHTVSILVAIIMDQSPCFGCICKPFGYRDQTSVLDTGCVAFYGGTLLGAAYTAGGSIVWNHTKFNQNNNGELPRAVISSSRASGIVQEFVTHLGSKGMIHPEPLMISGAGEKSLRIILRRENEGLWFFPKAGTCLWDVAASDALLRAMGGRLTDKNGNDMDYSKSRTEAENQNGVVACYDCQLHAECIRLFLEGTWMES